MVQSGAIQWAAVVGALAVVGAGGAWLEWRDTAIFKTPAVSASAAPPAPIAAPAEAKAAPVAAAAQAPAESASETPRPRFDILRVEPSGEAVIAGRAAPGAKVAITDAGAVVGEADADAAGQFVIIPPALAPGAHAFALTAQVGAGATLRSPGVVGVEVPAAAAPAKPPAAAPSPPAKLATLAGAPATRSLAALPAAAPPPAAKPAPTLLARADVASATTAPRTAITGVAADAAGRMAVTGDAAPGALLRLYLNGAPLAAVTAGPDGRWSLTVEHGMTAGAYALRADEIDRTSAAVVSRAEAPFDFPDLGPAPATGAAAPAAAAAAPATPAGEAHAVVRLVDTRKVVPGDSLWGISERLYGDGLRYTQIYAANSGQIRNPRLIYPGQVFVLPQPF